MLLSVLPLWVVPARVPLYGLTWTYKLIALTVRNPIMQCGYLNDKVRAQKSLEPEGKPGGSESGKVTSSRWTIPANGHQVQALALTGKLLMIVPYTGGCQGRPFSER